MDADCMVEAMSMAGFDMMIGGIITTADSTSTLLVAEGMLMRKDSKS